MIQTTLRISADTLEASCVEAMLKAGMRKKDAEVTARVLVTTDVWGTFTHGTKQLRKLLKNFRDGRMDPLAIPELVQEGPSWALYDGHCAMPMVSSVEAMKTTIEKAKHTGIAYTVVKNSGHYGAAGYYANMAAEAGLMGISMTNVDPAMAVPGSRVSVLGTNPLAYAVPRKCGKSVFLDIATSIVAASKVFIAQDLKQSIPDNWLIDRDGLPTTDPTGYPAVGAIMPMAGHKGYGIALMIEILTGVLSGGAFALNVPCWHFESSEPVDQTHTFFAIDISTVLPLERFHDRMECLIKMIHEAPKAKGVERIYLPGEIEWEHREKVLREGELSLPEDVALSLRGLADDYDLDLGV